MDQISIIGLLALLLSLSVSLTALPDVQAAGTPDSAVSSPSVLRSLNPFMVLQQKVTQINNQFQNLVVNALMEIENLELIPDEDPSESTTRELQQLNEEIIHIHSGIEELIAEIEENDEDDDRRRVKKLRRERNSQADIYMEWVEILRELSESFEAQQSRNFLSSFMNETNRLDQERVQAVEDYLKEFENSEVKGIDVQAFNVGKREKSLQRELTALKSSAHPSPGFMTRDLLGLIEWFQELIDKLKNVARNRDYSEPSLPAPQYTVHSIVNSAGRSWLELTVEEMVELIVEETGLQLQNRYQGLDELRRMGYLLLDSRKKVEEVWSQIEELPVPWYPGYVTN